MLPLQPPPTRRLVRFVASLPPDAVMRLHVALTDQTYQATLDYLDPDLHRISSAAGRPRSPGHRLRNPHRRRLLRRPPRNMPIIKRSDPGPISRRFPTSNQIITHTQEIYTMYRKPSLSGNVGRDAEIRYTPSGVPVTDFSVAANRRWTDRDGNPQEAPRGTRSFAGASWPKSPPNRSRRASSSWSRARSKPPPSPASDGEARATLELTANNFKFLGGRRDNGEDESDGQRTVGRTDEIGGDTEIPF